MVAMNEVHARPVPAGTRVLIFGGGETVAVGHPILVVVQMFEAFPG